MLLTAYQRCLQLEDDLDASLVADAAAAALDMSAHVPSEDDTSRSSQQGVVLFGEFVPAALRTKS